MCVFNRARCIFIQNFLKLRKLCGSKFPRKIRSPVKRLRILPLLFTVVPFKIELPTLFIYELRGWVLRVKGSGYTKITWENSPST